MKPIVFPWVFFLLLILNCQDATNPTTVSGNKTDFRVSLSISTDSTGSLQCLLSVATLKLPEEIPVVVINGTEKEAIGNLLLSWESGWFSCEENQLMDYRISMQGETLTGQFEVPVMIKDFTVNGVPVEANESIQIPRSGLATVAWNGPPASNYWIEYAIVTDTSLTSYIDSTAVNSIDIPLPVDATELDVFFRTGSSIKPGDTPDVANAFAYAYHFVQRESFALFVSFN